MPTPSSHPWQPVRRLMLCLTLIGCQHFGTLERDLSETRQIGAAVVEVVNKSGRNTPHLVLAIDADSLEVVQLDRLRGSGSVRLEAFPGLYDIAAFEDLNENMDHDPGEHSVLHGAPDLVPIGIDHGDANVTIEIGGDQPDATELHVELVERITAANTGLVFNNIGSVAGMDDGRFAPENGTLGMWEPAVFIRAELHGLYMHGAHRPGLTPVVFVHGIGGTPQGFRAMAQSLDPARFQAWSFYYPSAYPLEGLGRYLNKSIALMAARYGAPRIVLVGHSMGGLVALEAAQVAHESGTDFDVPLVVTIASPLSGLSSAQLGVEYAPTVMPCWRDLAPGSPFLRQLLRGGSETFDHDLFFSYRRSGVVGPSGDGTVPLTSQLRVEAQDRARRLVGLDAGHVNVLSDPECLRQLNRSLAGLTDDD